MARTIPFTRPARPTVPPQEPGYWLHVTAEQHRALLLLIAGVAAYRGVNLSPDLASEVNQICADRKR